MDQQTPKPDSPDSTPAYTLTVEQLRKLIREEIQAATTSQKEADRLLTAEEAAEMLSVSPDYLYRHAKKFPFTRKVGPKMLRFSRQGIIKWLESRKVNCRIDKYMS
jgi:excisionase family DNA binding protein